ncbi:MAG: 4Fe-4S binding protein [Firmicutes bacterium]|jgi:2-oxoglutarate ferredoxin oxidoreductase subunit delta|nr:4Fe-4S binding protein [Bacillota bacterium]
MDSPQEPENPVVVKLEWCKACGICIAVCPTKVLEAGAGGKAAVARPDECIRCETCEIMCPDFAIRVVGAKQRKAKPVKGDVQNVE